MPDKIVIKDVHPSYDGEYELDDDFTNRELHTIKRLSGCRVGELADALEASDTDVVMALALIALQRQGKHIDEDVLWDSTAGNISLVGADVLPPAEESPPTERDSKPSSSGTDSTSTSESPANGQSPTGAPPSDISATLASATSET